MSSPSNILYISDIVLPDMGQEAFLPPGGQEAAVTEVFSQYGAVQHVRLLANNHGASRVAIIRYQSIEEATAVIDQLNGNIPQGLLSPVMVKYANAPPGRVGSGGGGGGAPPQQMASSTFSPYGSGGGGAPSTSLAITPMVGTMGPMGMSPSLGSSSPMVGMSSGGSGHPGPTPVGPGGIPMDMICTALEKSGELPGGPSFQSVDSSVYVTNLPADSTDIHLFRMFSSFGPIAPMGVKVVYKPGGPACGLINYLIPASADAAISTLDGQQLPSGLQLKVSRKQQF